MAANNLYQIGYIALNDFEAESNLFTLCGNLYSDLNKAKEDVKALQTLYPLRYYIICSDLIRI